ncbi:MAG TPA: (4Fe-4S)-binding protein [Vicinamibacterales bacterium]|nr:(4Fe-4S)-binding protein [Vicinamibacterales bacterium]
MKDPIQQHGNDTIVVRFDPRVCIHSGVCLRGLHAVFDLKKRPWINLEAASAEAIAEQIKKCPSGALSFEMKGK